MKLLKTCGDIMVRITVEPTGTLISTHREATISEDFKQVITLK
ncbi:MAG: hypothetical protein ACTHML_02565 [Ginsengibacter sp.]